MQIPQIDEKIFRKFNIKLAYLFGSRAKGLSYEKSDFDIAVLFKKTPADPLALKELTFFSSELNKFFPTKIDTVSLNDAPLLLKYEVVAHSKIVYCENEAERINFEVSTIKEYIDDKYTRQIYYDALNERINQGVL